jgi:hypothetical protein
LSNGATLTDAAAQAGIRNTISNWRLNSPDFREALAIAHHDRAVLYRDRAVDLADLAFETLRALLTDPKSACGPPNRPPMHKIAQLPST